MTQGVGGYCKDDLREFASANERHPGDAHGKVGSERESESSDTAANFRQRSPTAGVDEIGRFSIAFRPRGTLFGRPELAYG